MLPAPDDVLDLPEPCLVVLIGAAGSGKTTFAARHFNATEVLSSDVFRAAVSGDAGDQSATRRAFAILNRTLNRRLAERRRTVVDATNVTAFARRSLLRRAAHHGVPAVAVVFALDPLLVLTRNATRTGRIVPQPAVEQQLRDLDRTLRRDLLAGEGFAAVRILRSPLAVNTLRLRGPEAASGSGGGR